MTDRFLRLPQILRRRNAVARTATPTPRCKCSHARQQHGRNGGRCFATVCVCATYRPDVKA
jgi:hypothetical protein